MTNENNTGVMCPNTWLKARTLMQRLFDDLLIDGHREAASRVSKYLTTMDKGLDEHDRKMEAWRLQLEEAPPVEPIKGNAEVNEAVRHDLLRHHSQGGVILPNEQLMDLQENILRRQGRYPEVLSEEEFQNLLTLEAEKDNQRY